MLIFISIYHIPEYVFRTKIDLVRIYVENHAVSSHDCGTALELVFKEDQPIYHFEEITEARRSDGTVSAVPNPGFWTLSMRDEKLPGRMFGYFDIWTSIPRLMDDDHSRGDIRSFVKYLKLSGAEVDQPRLNTAMVMRNNVAFGDDHVYMPTWSFGELEEFCMKRSELVIESKEPMDRDLLSGFDYIVRTIPNWKSHIDFVVGLKNVLFGSDAVILFAHRFPSAAEYYEAMYNEGSPYIHLLGRDYNEYNTQKVVEVCRQRGFNLGLFFPLGPNEP
jgi:hypothetical protein